MSNIIEILQVDVIDSVLPTKVKDLDIIGYLLQRDHYSNVDDAIDSGVTTPKKFRYVVKIEVEEIPL